MCPPTRPPTDQELHGRKGRPITDQDAHDINRVEELSYELQISQVMSRQLHTASPLMEIKDILEILRQNRISGTPVMDGGSLVGVISLEDVVRALEKGELTAPVQNYMTPRVKSVNSYDPVIKALETFTETGLGRLPVLDEEQKLVGMITKGDITRGVLIALQHDYKEEEVRQYRASHLFQDIVSDRTTLVLRYNIKAHDFTLGGKASGALKRALIRLGADQQIARRCGIAVYEAEMNLIIHTNNGGILKMEVEPHKITMSATDDGPGIPDIQKALQPGWSTAPDRVREMGFGAGMGLVNIKRCVDEMEIDSVPGKGTKLIMRIFVRDETISGRSEGNA